MTNSELKNFIKQNAYFIYEYINKEVLNGIGVMNPDFFVQTIRELFVENNDLKIYEAYKTTNIIPYVILTQLSQNGTIAYTSLRAETINFKQLDKEASVYYNYARFTIKETFLTIELMQSKTGGMPIDADIVKFSKNITINSIGLEDFIAENKTSNLKDVYKKVNEAINNIF